MRINERLALLRSYRFLSPIKIDELATSSLLPSTIRKLESTTPLIDARQIKFYSETFGISPNYFIDGLYYFGYDFIIPKINYLAFRKSKSPKSPYVSISDVRLQNITPTSLINYEKIISNLYRIKVGDIWVDMLISARDIPNYRPSGVNDNFMRKIGGFPLALFSPEDCNKKDCLIYAARIYGDDIDGFMYKLKMVNSMGDVVACDNEVIDISIKEMDFLGVNVDINRLEEYKHLFSYYK